MKFLALLIVSATLNTADAIAFLCPACPRGVQNVVLQLTSTEFMGNSMEPQTYATLSGYQHRERISEISNINKFTGSEQKLIYSDPE